jgi:hypothetical protein
MRLPVIPNCRKGEPDVDISKESRFPGASLGFEQPWSGAGFDFY